MWGGVSTVLYVIHKHSSPLVSVLFFISVLLNALNLIRFVSVYLFLMTSSVTVRVHPQQMGGKQHEEKQK